MRTRTTLQSCTKVWARNPLQNKIQAPGFPSQRNVGAWCCWDHAPPRRLCTSSMLTSYFSSTREAASRWTTNRSSTSTRLLRVRRSPPSSQPALQTPLHHRDLGTHHRTASQLPVLTLMPPSSLRHWSPLHSPRKLEYTRATSAVRELAPPTEHPSTKVNSSRRNPGLCSVASVPPFGSALCTNQNTCHLVTRSCFEKLACAVLAL
mmetsp:Transcript_11316/g.32571  ORF Transcript_11316/g.32571 Transcript_11316/m.32571 type:complete len:206 (+) Transcript_11316:1713-2330(+)